MKIELSLAQEEYVRSLVATGFYKDESDVVRDALRHLGRREAPPDGEASLEYLIGVAGRLTRGDHREHVGELTAALDQLKGDAARLLAAIRTMLPERAVQNGPELSRSLAVALTACLFARSLCDADHDGQR